MARDFSLEIRRGGVELVALKRWERFAPLRGQGAEGGMFACESILRGVYGVISSFTLGG